MASLVVLERHLWLTLTEIKDADRVSFLDAPISPSGLFGPAVKGFAERFTQAQKASQAMRHFLPKRSSPAAAQSRPRTAPTQQPVKPAPAVFAPQPARTQQPRGRSHSARRHPPPKRQGPRLKIALDPAPPAASWSAGQEEERVESRHGRTAHQKASHEKPLGTPFFSGCRGNCVCCYRVRTSDHATVRCDSGKNKTQTFSKRKQFSSSVPHECPASVQPATRVYPTLATRAEAWQAIPGVSEWVMGIIKRGYSLQFARRPLRFSGVVSTSVQGENAFVLRSEVIRILNYLDDWLILAQSEVELLSHRTLILSHLERLGLRVNFSKSALSPSQRISFLGTVLDSAHTRAVIAHRQCYSWACSACAPFNAGWNHGFHTMHGVTDACISGWIRPV